MTDSAYPVGQERGSTLDRTLAQQMKINQMEIDRRLRLIGIKDQDVQVLKPRNPENGAHG